MYGTQADKAGMTLAISFENDVKMYGTQAITMKICNTGEFENDVKMYGTQAKNCRNQPVNRLRMM